MRSEDGGHTWQSDPAFGEGQRLQAIAWAPSDAKIAYASRGRGLLRSDDGGDRIWAATLLPDTTQVSDIQVSAQDPNAVFLLSDGRVLFSADGGQAWGVLSLPVDVSAQVLALSHQQANVMYVLSGNSLYRSEDAGESWTSRTDELPYASDLLVDSLDDQHLLALTNNGALVSHDGGVIWKPSASAVGSGQLQAAIVDPLNPSVAFAHDGRQMVASLSAGDAWYAIGQPIAAGIADVVITGDEPRSLLVMASGSALWRYSSARCPCYPHPLAYRDTDGHPHASVDAHAHADAAATTCRSSGRYPSDLGAAAAAEHVERR